MGGTTAMAMPSGPMLVGPLRDEAFWPSNRSRTLHLRGKKVGKGGGGGE